MNAIESIERISLMIFKTLQIWQSNIYNAGQVYDFNNEPKFSLTAIWAKNLSIPFDCLYPILGKLEMLIGMHPKVVTHPINTV